MFLTLEDETGLINVTVRPDLFERFHAVLVEVGILEIVGTLQNFEGVSVRATEVRALDPAMPCPSRDFH